MTGYISLFLSLFVCYNLVRYLINGILYSLESFLMIYLPLLRVMVSLVYIARHLDIVIFH